MKKLKKISLSKLNEVQLDKKQQQLIFGGNSCKCGSCSSGTPTETNRSYNHADNITGTGTNNPWQCECSAGDNAFSGGLA